MQAAKQLLGSSNSVFQQMIRLKEEEIILNEIFLHPHLTFHSFEFAQFGEVREPLADHQPPGSAAGKFKKRVLVNL